MNLDLVHRYRGEAEGVVKPPRGRHDRQDLLDALETRVDYKNGEELVAEVALEPPVRTNPPSKGCVLPRAVWREPPQLYDSTGPDAPGVNPKVS